MLSQGDVIVHDAVSSTAAVTIGLGRGQRLIVSVSDDPHDTRRINVRHARADEEPKSIGHCSLDLRTGEVTR